MQIELSEPQEFNATSLKPINLFLAGVGSGKTHLGGILSGDLIQNFPEVIGFIGANTYKQLNTSTLVRIREVWKTYLNMIEGRDYVVGIKPPKEFKRIHDTFEGYDSIISFRWGTVIFTGSLDNYKAHDGKQFGWCILDETKDTREEAVKEVILARLRQKGMWIDGDGELINREELELRIADEQYYTTDENEILEHGTLNQIKPYNPLIILTSPAKVEWINNWFQLDKYEAEILGTIYNKKNFFKIETADKCVTISSSFHNSKNLPSNYLETLLNNNTEERGNMLVYANPFTRTGGEFYSGFQRSLHVGDVDIIDGLPIHVTFDQNVVPYITATLHQIRVLEDGTKQIRQFAELCLPNPRNTTRALAMEILEKYGRYLKNGLFYYGDPSGLKGSTRDEIRDTKRQNDYQIVHSVLRKYVTNASNRTTRRYPRVLKRKDFINAALEGRVEKVQILIGRQCVNTIADYTYLKEDENGKKNKEKFTDEITKQSYEKYGHTSDANDYFYCKILEREFQKYSNL